MSGYKLTYFNITGLGEPIRFILSYAGIKFEDNRIAKENWPQLKPQTPLEQLPILEIDGKTFYQSNAIARYLAKKFNLNGSNDLESFEVDAALETIGEFRQLFAKWYFGPDAAVKAATKEETFKKAAFYLNKFDKTIKENNGYFVGGKISVADLVFTGLSYFFNHIAERDIIAEYPNVKKVVEKVLAESSIKSYLAKRPKTDF